MGNPNLKPGTNQAVAVEANKSAADKHAATVAPIIGEIRKAGITSLQGIARALTARGIKTARGGDWTATAVRNLLGRL